MLKKKIDSSTCHHHNVGSHCLKTHRNCVIVLLSLEVSSDMARPPTTDDPYHATT